MVVVALYCLAYSQYKLKRWEEAAVSGTESLRLRRKMFPHGHVRITESKDNSIFSVYRSERVYMYIYLLQL